MSDEIRLVVSGKINRGRFPVSIVRGAKDVLLNGRVDVHKPEEIDAFILRVKEQLPGMNGEAEVLRAELMRLAIPPEKKPATPSTPPASPHATSAELLDKTPKDVRDAADAMLADPYLLKTIFKDTEDLGVAGERGLVATVYLIGVSRLADKTLAGIVQGHSSSGKSYIVERTSTLFPPESVIFAQQMTPQALFHMPPGGLEHRFVVAGERSRKEDDDTAETTRALREMLSSGRLSKLCPMKDEHGHIVTQLIEQPGPISYIETTTIQKVFDEDANRCILLATDEREEQTRAIINSIADSREGKRFDTAPIIARHHAAQRMLAAECAPVVIPFAKRLGDLFPAQRPEARRAFGHVLTAIEACALLHLRQRNKDATGRIIAAQDDYAIVRELLSGSLSRSIGGAISDGAKRFHERLCGWASGRFTASEAYHRESFSDRCIRGWLAELYRVGLVNLVESGRGKATVWELTDQQDNPSQSPLPTVELVFNHASGASKLPTGSNQ